jgi:TatD DNase family protein
MASDAHAHPFDLKEYVLDAEAERQNLKIACAASAWNKEQFLYHERLSQESKDCGGPVMLLCFGIHPQLPRHSEQTAEIDPLCQYLQELAEGKRLHAIGETGFDHFDEDFRASADIQKALFLQHLAVAKKYDLPIVLHIRKAMDQVFCYAKELAALPSVIFHSYSGTFREAGDLLKRKVNAYFSFGTPIALNHKKAMEAASLLPPERLLTETDAPYQPLRNSHYSSWKDIHTVINAMADLRSKSGASCKNLEEVEMQTDSNFRKAFLID